MKSSKVQTLDAISRQCLMRTKYSCSRTGQAMGHHLRGSYLSREPVSHRVEAGVDSTEQQR